MKRIIVREGEKFGTKAVIKQIAQYPSEGQRMNIVELDQRLKVIHALDKANGHLDLEDADHAMLKAAFQSASWAVADDELSQVIHDVLEAKDPPSEEIPQPPASPE